MAARPPGALTYQAGPGTKSAKLTVDVVYTPANGAAVQGQTKLTLKR